MCLTAATLVFGFKLHKVVVYRLALYQVLAALAFATVELLQILMINYQDNRDAYGRVCIAIGWFGLYFILVNLLFNMWVTVHLFSFAVLHKNPTKLEPLYVVTSLLVPAAIASVPLATQSYGLSQVDGCNMPVYSSNSTVKLGAAVIERFALWEGPAMSISLTASTAMFVMVIRFAHRVWWRTNYEPIADNDQYWKAIKQLIPLAFFPIFFFVFIIPYFMYDIYYSFFTPTPNRGLVTFENVSILLWSLSSGLTLNVHIFVSRMCVKKTRPAANKTPRYTSENLTVTYASETPPSMHNSSTWFTVSIGSMGDDVRK